MKNKIKEYLRNHLINIRGWRTDRKIVVIESDDWGSIRLPGKEVLPKLKKLGIRLEEDHYIRNDSLASEKDLSLLFELLSSIENHKIEKPVITANTIMANPDFRRIRNSGYKEYVYQLFPETLKEYPEHTNSFQTWREGIQAGVIHPQFHGREHLNVPRWFNYLQMQSYETVNAFDLELFGISYKTTTENRRSYQAAFEYESDREKEFVLDAVKEGLKEFMNLFGYRSLSAIAPNYTWCSEVEKVMLEQGVKYLQGSMVQKIPDLNNGQIRYRRHYTSEKNRFGQTYLVRNCYFEPSSDPQKDWVDSCLAEIKKAFLWNKPAIIESHRVNYIGYINPGNRDRTLILLKKLLNKIVKTWPDVEFMTSDQLGKIIEGGDG